MRLLALAAFLVLAGGASCASSPGLVAARKGDFASLKRDVAAEEKLGRLTNSEAAELAAAVAAWEIASGPPDDQLARVGDARACARAVDGALASRMKVRDRAGAEAALARAESGEISASDARDYAKDPDDGWRAVGARGLVRDEDDAARRRAFADPAPGVRRSAMHAALIARDPRDVDALSEVARLDPEPIVRTDAVRALAVIGGAPVVSKLRDLWSSADEPLREDIAAAWASPAVFDAEEQGGGHGELRLLLAQGHGPAAIEGAGVVLRGVVHDAELASSATALLARVMGKGSTRDRLHAIAIAPRAPAGPILDSLRDAAKSDDVTVRVAALARLTESPTDREASIRALETIAGDAERHATAARAKLSLASAGDLRVQAWVEADLVADDPSIRLSAAAALAALGRAGRAAPLLADSDASVRMRAACTLLVAARR